MNTRYEWKYKEEAFLPLPVLDKSKRRTTPEDAFHRVNSRIDEIIKELNNETLKAHFGKKVTDEFIPALNQIKSNLKAMHKRINVEFQGMPHNPTNPTSHKARELVRELYYRLELTMEPIVPSPLGQSVEEAIERASESAKNHADQIDNIIDDLSYISQKKYEDHYRQYRRKSFDWNEYKNIGFVIAVVFVLIAIVALSISAALTGGAGLAVGAVAAGCLLILMTKIPPKLTRAEEAHQIEKIEREVEKIEYDGKLSSLVTEKMEIKKALPSVSDIPKGIFAAKTKLKDAEPSEDKKDENVHSQMGKSRD